MPDKKLENDLLLILEHVNEAIAYFEEIKHPDDFINSKNGKAYFDAILMHLQAMGEVLKRCYLQNASLFKKYSSIPWDEIIRMRDLISHHYDKLQHEIVYDICKNHLLPLKTAVTTILQEP